MEEENIADYVLSRKNFLFCGSEDGARSTCLRIVSRKKLTEIVL